MQSHDRLVITMIIMMVTCHPIGNQQLHVSKCRDGSFGGHFPKIYFSTLVLAWAAKHAKCDKRLCYCPSNHFLRDIRNPILVDC